jgi:HEAT repeat protein
VAASMECGFGCFTSSSHLPVGKNQTLTPYPLVSDRSTTNFFTGSPLAALTTLSFSDNVDLQRSAALAFAEITEKEVHEVGRDTLDPVLYLLTSHDPEVQRAASAALGNLAVNGECALWLHWFDVRMLTVRQPRTSS